MPVVLDIIGGHSRVADPAKAKLSISSQMLFRSPIVDHGIHRHSDTVPAENFL